MTFKERQIDVQFTLADDAFPGGSKTLSLKRHRIQASISSEARGAFAHYAIAIRIFGMRLLDMNALTIWNREGVLNATNRITVTAGNAGEMLYTVFDGTIFGAVPQFDDNGESSFVVTGRGALMEQVTPAAPKHYEGTLDVRSLIAGLAQQAGLTFQDHGVTAKISGQYLWGSTMDQIERLAMASRTVALLDHRRVLHIWPADGFPKLPEVNLAPGQGLIGYPKFEPTGMVVRAEFDPALLYGSQVNVKSIIPLATGKWSIISLTHDLTTLTPNGGWFTDLRLNLPGFTYCRVN
ncbi:baseplate hub protein [Paraburkholderia sp. MM6662-R1]|uniref:baseplate hub protein n=1 Tax=Paraburkholderia sp. MM6662-R1 TaxID=2991066 RepID=UPI003D1C4BB8